MLGTQSRVKANELWTQSICKTYRIIIIIILSDCINPQGVYSQLNKSFTYAAGRTDWYQK